jgi:hypothetical protein
MGFGVILIFFSIILWSMYSKFSSACLAVTAVLVYASILVNLLDHYQIIDTDRMFVYKDVPLLKYALPLLILVSFIVTLVIFLKEEKTNRTN